MSQDKAADRQSRISVADAPKLIAALEWVDQVYPGKDRNGAAVVCMTWIEWNALRAALGLPIQPERKSK